MWWKRRRLSDAEFVERIRGITRLRRWVAAVFAVIALGMFACSGYFVHLLESGELPIRDDGFEQLIFQIGVTTGLVGGIVISSALYYFISSVHLFLPDRKDELLLDYHRRLAELDQLPVGSE